MTSAEFRALLYRARDRRQRIPKLAAIGRPVLLPLDGHGIGLVCPDPSEPGRWRFSRFEGATPTGHSTHDSIGSALEETLYHGAALDRAVNVNADNVDSDLEKMA